MTSGLSQKKIDVTFALGEGQFGTTGFNTVKVTGLRIEVTISKAGGIFQGALNLRVYGLDIDIMNKLSHVGRLATSVIKNVVTVEAGDDIQGMAVIYQGTIYQAWADFNGIPDVAFTVEAQAAYIESIQTTDPSSYQGSVDAAIVINNLAQRMGKTFENNGVSVILHDPYYHGSLVEQVKQCVEEARIDSTYDNNILAIWPLNGSRQVNTVIPVISPSSGMMGYPKFNATGITLTTLFDPGITMGGQIKVESIITAATGVWKVNQMAINLEANNPQGGAWFITMDCCSLERIVLPASNNG